jgi:hypothetical protein
VGKGSHNAVIQQMVVRQLSTQSKRSNQSTIALWVRAIQVLQHAAALADQLEQSPAGMIIMLVL